MGYALSPGCPLWDVSSSFHESPAHVLPRRNKHHSPCPHPLYSVLTFTLELSLPLGRRMLSKLSPLKTGSGSWDGGTVGTAGGSAGQGGGSWPSGSHKHPSSGATRAFALAPGGKPEKYLEDELPPLTGRRTGPRVDHGRYSPAYCLSTSPSAHPQADHLPSLCQRGRCCGIW